MEAYQWMSMQWIINKKAKNEKRKACVYECARENRSENYLMIFNTCLGQKATNDDDDEEREKMESKERVSGRALACVSMCCTWFELIVLNNDCASVIWYKSLTERMRALISS